MLALSISLFVLFLLLIICCYAEDLLEIISANTHSFEDGADDSEYYLSIATEMLNKNNSNNNNNKISNNNNNNVNVNVNKQRFLLKKLSLFSLQNVKLLTGGAHKILPSKQMLPSNKALPNKRFLRNIPSLDTGNGNKRRKEFDVDAASLPGMLLSNLDRVKMKAELVGDDVKSMLSFAADSADFIPADDQKQVGAQKAQTGIMPETVAV